MGKVTRTPIYSSALDDDSFPWARFTLDPDTLELDMRVFNGLQDPAKHDALLGKRKLKLHVDPEKAKERHALIVTNEGELAFLPFSELPAVLYAHLAFYDPETGDLEVLDFKRRPQ